MSNKELYTIIAVLLLWFWGTVIAIVWHFTRPTPVKYDCSLAEIHPDYPREVRERCRLLRNGAKIT